MPFLVNFQANNLKGYYLIGQKYVRKKWRNLSEVTKIFSDEKFYPTKIFSKNKILCFG